MDDLALVGKTALITGVSRRRGIGFAVATALARLGASVFVQHYRWHDERMPWGADDIDAVLHQLRAELVGDARLGQQSADLRDAVACDDLIDAAHALTGRVDILVCNHARSGGDGSVLDLTAETLDQFWDTNTRSTLLLTGAFARRASGRSAPGARPGDRAASQHVTAPVARVFWMTSGQLHGPMRGEVAYATSKAALAGVTATVAAELLDLGILLNTINPGPVNTGYLDPECTDRDLDQIDQVISQLPFGRFGTPADPAALISWLCTDAGAWVVGQVLTSDGGFSLT